MTRRQEKIIVYVIAPLIALGLYSPLFYYNHIYLKGERQKFEEYKKVACKESGDYEYCSNLMNKMFEGSAENYAEFIKLNQFQPL